MLEVNFEKYESGADMVRNGEFAIQDEGTCVDVDLSQPWDICFFPGQRVNMSMIFTRSDSADKDCPKCKAVSGGKGDQDIEWYTHLQSLIEITKIKHSSKCGLIFRRVTDVDADEEGTLDTAQMEENPEDNWMKETLAPPNPLNLRSSKNKRHVRDPNITPYRRIRIRIISPPEILTTQFVIMNDNQSRLREPTTIEWVQLRPIIYALYKIHDHTLQKVCVTLRDKFGFKMR